MNVLKLTTADEARALAELADVGIQASKAKELSDKIATLARRGLYDCNIADIPAAYIDLLRALGFTVNQVTNNLINISWV